MLAIHLDFLFSCIYCRVFISVVGINGRWCCGYFHWYIVLFSLVWILYYLFLLLLVLILYYCIGIDVVFFHWYLILYFYIGIHIVFFVGIIANVSDGCEIRLETNTEHPRTSLVWPQV